MKNRHMPRTFKKKRKCICSNTVAMLWGYHLTFNRQLLCKSFITMIFLLNTFLKKFIVTTVLILQGKQFEEISCATLKHLLCIYTQHICFHRLCTFLTLKLLVERERRGRTKDR